ncbi:unnamed protein product, partial [marine sediment metagenome]
LEDIFIFLGLERKRLVMGELDVTTKISSCEVCHKRRSYYPPMTIYVIVESQ